MHPLQEVRLETARLFLTSATFNAQSFATKTLAMVLEDLFASHTFQGMEVIDFDPKSISSDNEYEVYGVIFV